MRQPQAFTGQVINTAEAIPPLTAEETRRLADLQANARRQLQAAAAAARKAWAANFAARRGLSELAPVRSLSRSISRATAGYRRFLGNSPSCPRRGGREPTRTARNATLIDDAEPLLGLAPTASRSLRLGAASSTSVHPTIGAKQPM